jgi:hypothetical protein
MGAQIMAEIVMIITMIDPEVVTEMAFEVEAAGAEMEGGGGMIAIATIEMGGGVPTEVVEVDPEVLAVLEALIDMEVGET